SSACLGVTLVTFGFEPVSKLTATLFDDAAIDEDVHEVGLDVAQDPRVVGDQQHAAVLLGPEPVDTFGDDTKRVDIKTGVSLVEDREFGVQQLELKDLMPLLLATGESLVDVALREGSVDLQLRHRRL